MIPEPKFDYLPFAGGLDLVTPAIQAKPGTLRESLNCEVGIEGRYDYIDGYERLDGQAAPSAAAYGLMTVTITGSFAADDTITGADSSETAVVVQVNVSDDSNLIVTKISGAFTPGENLTVSGVQGTVIADAVIDGGDTAENHAKYKNLAADEYRSDITAVPGIGSVLGVEMMNDIKYAWRNNAGPTNAILHKSSGAGWVEVALGRELAFTNVGRTTVIAEGDVITGASSGCVATITRVVLESGAFSAGTATGRFIFASQTTTFQAEDVNVSASPVAAILTDSSAITMLPSGRFESVMYNFGGAAGTERMYGCDGINRGFEFDGTVFVPIATGMTTDTPLHVATHKYHLFFSYGSSLQHSGTGTPYIWTPVVGASEIAVGDTITDLRAQPGSSLGGASTTSIGGGALSVFSRNSTHVLYGSSTTDWTLQRFRDEVGAYPYTTQEVGTTILLDDRGVSFFNTTDEYGNFSHSTASQLIQPWIVSRRTAAIASCIVRDKNQYRLFFTTGDALYVTLNGREITGMMPVTLTDAVTVMTSRELNDGTEVILFGSDNGFVYQMDKGTSFDGENIERVLNLHYHHSNGPRVAKSYKAASIEVDADGYTEFSFSYELGYTSTEYVQPGTVTYPLALSGGRWDSGSWDTGFFWDSPKLAPTEALLEGYAQNISLIFRANSDYLASAKLSGAMLTYLPRRRLRA